jgi:hypothetical protein
MSEGEEDRSSISSAERLQTIKKRKISISHARVYVRAPARDRPSTASGMHAYTYILITSLQLNAAYRHV